MDEGAVGFLIGLILAGILGFVACCVTAGVHNDSWRQEAVDKGHAKWTISDKGEKKWDWLPAKEAE